MATTRRRARTDSIQAQLAAMKDANSSHPWPELIPRHSDAERHAEELAHYRNLLGERSFDDWSPLSLATAARAAVLLAFTSRLAAEVVVEGPLTLGGKHGDTPVRNPLLDALATANSNLTILLRQIGLAVPSVDRQALANSGKAARTARSVLDRAKGDPLLHGDGADLLA